MTSSTFEGTSTLAITLELQFFKFLLRGLMVALLMSPWRGQIVGMIIGKLLMMSLKNSCNPNLPCII